MTKSFSEIASSISQIIKKPLSESEIQKMNLIMADEMNLDIEKYKISFYMPDTKLYEAELIFNNKLTNEEVIVEFVHKRFIQTKTKIVNPAQFTVIDKIEYLGNK